MRTNKNLTPMSLFKDKCFLKGAWTTISIVVYLTVLGVLSVYTHRVFIFLIVPSLFAWMFYTEKDCEDKGFLGVVFSAMILTFIGSILLICFVSGVKYNV